jgi:hypothetical protein
VTAPARRHEQVEHSQLARGDVGVVAGHERGIADDATIGLGHQDAEAAAAAEGVAPDDGRREPLREMLVAVERVGQPGDDGRIARPGAPDADRG